MSKKIESHCLCYLEASIPPSLGRRFESVRKLYPNLPDGEFFIQVLSLGLSLMDVRGVDET